MKIQISQTKKRILSFLLVLSLVCSCIPTMAITAGALPSADTSDPQFTLYYELYDNTNKLSTDADGDNAWDITVGTTYTAKVFLKSSMDCNLRGFDFTASYDTSKLDVITQDTDKKYDGVITTEAGKLRYYLARPEVGSEGDKTYHYVMTANSPLQIAQFSFKATSALAAGETISLKFLDGAKASVMSNVNALPVTTESVSVDRLQEYTVKFDMNGHGSAIESQTIVYGQTVTEPTAPTANGYTFDGWYLDDGKFNFSTPVTNNLELVASWTANNDTVTVELDGGTAESDTVSDTKTYTSDDNNILGTPTKTGYVFMGWEVTEIDSTGANSWTKGETYEGAQSVEGMYGNFKMKATWELSSVNDPDSHILLVNYRYAPKDYVLALIDQPLADGSTLAYNNSPMWYSEDTDYSNLFKTEKGTETTGLYLALIPESYQDNISDFTKSLSEITGEKPVLVYNNKVDNEDAVTYNDASLVYQMVRRGGDIWGYNSNDQKTYLSEVSRLRAEADNDASNLSAGTIQDVLTILEAAGLYTPPEG